MSLGHLCIYFDSENEYLLHALGLSGLSVDSSDIFNIICDLPVESSVQFKVTVREKNWFNRQNIYKYLRLQKRIGKDKVFYVIIMVTCGISGLLLTRIIFCMLQNRRWTNIMSFRSINEIETFLFEDCQIGAFEVCEGEICMELEALIVKSNNSQNANYTESYAGTTHVRLKGAKILSGVMEGYKYFDANDVLVEEVADKPLSAEEMGALLKSCEGYYLYGMEQERKEEDTYYYVISFEVPQEEIYDTSVTNPYRIQIAFTQAIFEWEVYLNRVQR